MSDLQNYIHARKATAPAFAADYDTGYQHFKSEAVAQQAYARADQNLQNQPNSVFEDNSRSLAYA